MLQALPKLALDASKRQPQLHIVLTLGAPELEAALQVGSHKWNHHGQLLSSILNSQSFPDFPNSAEDGSQESRITDADLVFHHVLQEPGVSTPEQHFSTEVRLTVNARRRSLERNPKPGRCPFVQVPLVSSWDKQLQALDQTENIFGFFSEQSQSLNNLKTIYPSAKWIFLRKESC